MPLANVDEVHRGAYVADAHADALMWNRDLAVASTRGDVDFPRLREGGVKLQCFTLVTQGLPILGGFGALARLNGWPPAALRDEGTRADYQIDRLEDFCARPEAQAALVRSAADLTRAEREDRIGAVLGVEGGQALRGDPANVERLHRRGVRFLSLTHLLHNDLGGSSHWLARGHGLTGLGREVLAEMARLNMAVDVAHASAKLLGDVLEQSRGPIFCSHTGLAGVTPKWRNLPDDAVRAIAARGGVVCVIFATQYLGGSRLEHLLRHFDHALALVGPAHVGMGSDFDGFVRFPKPMRDARDLRLVTGGLLERGVPVPDVQAVLGGSLRRFLETRVLT